MRKCGSGVVWGHLHSRVLWSVCVDNNRVRKPPGMQVEAEINASTNACVPLLRNSLQLCNY